MKNLALIILCITLFSCSKENQLDCLKSFGELIEEEREIQSFSKLVINDDINVVLTQSKSTTVNVVSGANIIKNIATDFSDATLTLSNNNICNWTRSYKNETTVYISYQRISSITFTGSGNVIFENEMIGNSIVIDCWGAGGEIITKLNVNAAHLNIHTATANIVASGSCHNNYCYSASYGFIDAKNLACKNAYVRHYGSGNISVSPTDILSINYRSIGDILYYGSPKKTQFNKLDEKSPGRIINM